MINIQRSENYTDICRFENCDRIANYRRLKVGNCHLKNTQYEYCAYHRPKNSINKKFPCKSIFDQQGIPLKYYNIIYYQNIIIIFYIYSKIINSDFL